MQSLMKWMRRAGRNGRSLERTFRPDGVRAMVDRVGYWTVRRKKREWQEYLRTIPKSSAACPLKQGIVICAGGVQYLTCAWVNIQMLRRHGCELPIEVWHCEHEITDSVKERFGALNVECRNIERVAGFNVKRYATKPLAILHSRFEKVLYLDADNVCVRDPSYLFDRSEFLDTGAVFWPDHWKTEPRNPIWKLTGSSDFDSPEQESGQLLVDKSKCWKALNLCCHFNLDSQFYYRLLLGDKDTFRFAWLAAKTPFVMIDHPVGQCGYVDSRNRFISTTLVQHDFRGDIIFLHRNSLKWDLIRPNEYTWRQVRTFKKQAQKRQYFWNSCDFLELRGDVEVKAFDALFPDLERHCLTSLEEFRGSSCYFEFLKHAYLLRFRHAPAPCDGPPWGGRHPPVNSEPHSAGSSRFGLFRKKTCIEKYRKYLGRRYATLAYAFKAFVDAHGHTIVELGTSRSFVGSGEGAMKNDVRYWKSNKPKNWDWGAGVFTRMCAMQLQAYRPKIHTVDISADAIGIAKVMTSEFSDLLTYHLKSSEEFLTKFEGSIDLLYMDTGETQLGADELHLREAEIIIRRKLLSPNAIILIDDVDITGSENSKGRLSIPYLCQNGFEVVASDYQVVLRRAATPAKVAAGNQIVDLEVDRRAAIVRD